jgi:geranylgeranyl reductase family protein
MTGLRRLEPSLDADILIAGGGPAGAATACHLARMGLRVLIADRQAFPRDKVCGDFVGPAAIDELKRLGVTALPTFRSTNRIRGAALFLDGQRLIAQSLPSAGGWAPEGRVIPRLELDDWILRAALDAGARLAPGCRVTGFTVRDGMVEVATQGSGGPRQLRGRLLIGADGSTSTIARLLRGGPPSKERRIVAVRAYYDRVSGPSDQADLYFTRHSFPGYCWLFPTGRATANVGIGMVLETVPPTDDHLRDLLLETVQTDQALRRRLAGARMTGKVVGWPLTTYDRRAPLSGERVLLVGDAAGLINPLNGEGIQYALASARWAAEVVAGCVARHDYSATALTPYGAQVEQALRYDMALAGLIVQLIRNRALNPVWFQALRAITGRARVDPEYAFVAGGILAGLVPARDAVSVLLVGGTVRQAAAMLRAEVLPATAPEPRRLAQAGLTLARIGYGVAQESARHPRDMFNWVRSVAAGAVEFAGRAATAPAHRSGRR